MNYKLRQQLIRDEGLRLRLYTDTVGKTSIGVGRNLTDIGISYATAEQMLEEDVDTAVNALTRAYSWFSGLDDVRKAVCINVMFNTGAAGYAKFRRFNQAMAEGNYLKASLELADSRLAPARRARLVLQMRTGLWDGKPMAGVVQDMAGTVVVDVVD